MAATAYWQHFHHVADIGVRGHGDTVEAAFAQAALAMTAVIADPARVANNSCIELDCEAGDLDYLFYSWMNALVYEMATRRMLFSRFDVRITGNRLHATVCGEVVNRQKHRPAVEIKGATFTELRVEQDGEGHWLAQCVVDV